MITRRFSLISALARYGWLFLLALWMPQAQAALPDTPVQAAYVTNGFVNAIVIDGATTYLGGSFSQIGPATGYGAPFDASTGAVGPYPSVNASISAVAADGSGGWYIGGPFTKVGTLSRNYLAHILADGSVDANWNPNPNGAINALAVGNGKVYAGGDFTTLGGQSRNKLAALDTGGTGAADASWNPNPSGYANFFVLPTSINALAVSGNTVYVGGMFSSIGGQSLNNLAKLDASGTGAADANWSPNPGMYVPFCVQLSALAVSGNTLYVGGMFSSIGGQSITNLAKLDAGGTGAADANWNPNPSFRVYALAVDGGSVYVGGSFTSIGGQSRNNIAALDVSGTGTATSWNPNANGQVSDLVVSGSLVYVGGGFTSIGGLSRNGLAALHQSDGLADASWDPNPNSGVGALAVGGGQVYVGGSFTSFGGVARSNLAAVSTATGIPTPWDPNARGVVYALALKNGALYAGGNFTTMGGQTRNMLAAFSTATVQLDANWNPGASGQVNALAVNSDGSLVYAGGVFTSIGGQSRNIIAALNPAGTSGTATSWNPVANSFGVNALAVTDTTVYAGGGFTSIGGQTRSNLAALSASTGLADTTWNPSPDSSVRALTLSADGNTLYVGGNFTSIGGQARNRIAALSTSGTGTASSWDPNADNNVYALAVNGSTVYAGGHQITRIGGQSRNLVAALDATTGAATAWNPNLTGDSIYVFNGLVRSVMALAVSADGNTAYVGGAFAAIGGNSRSTLGLFKTAASNANLSNLVSSGGALVPTFDSATTAYTQSVANTTTSLTVNPTFADSNATATVSLNGGTATPIANGATSSPLTLNVGDNTVAVTVTAEDGTTTKTYTLTVTRAKGDTTTAVGSSLNPSNVGSSVTFTATIIPAADGGIVNFKDGANVFGSISASNGSAQVSTSALTVGNHSITAVYAGNSSYKGSTSTALTQTINGPAGLSAAITNKAGTYNGLRTWSVTISNNGSSAASAAKLDSFTISMSGRCQPVVTTSFPVNLGDIAVGGSKTGTVLIDFSGCVKLAKFNASVGYSANGVVTGTTPLVGVGQ